jgi:hypothetical protein
MTNEDYRWVRLKNGESRLVNGNEEIQIKKDIRISNIKSILQGT